MSDTQGVSRYLGGESGHRGFFGGSHSRTRVVFVGIFLAAGLLFTPLLGWIAVVTATAAIGIIILLTARTHRGTILERRTRRSRWKARRRTGVAVYTPYEVGTWDQLQAAVQQGSKQERQDATQRIAQMRANPDGADGMGWLQFGSNQPGIAWHAPVGERPYLSVTFAVSGQLQGVETSGVLTRAAHGWGSFLASHAAPTSLVRGVQTLTRVLPPDTAWQQAWVALQLDPAATAEQQQSYKEVIERTGRDAMVQRHYVTLSWPITVAFTDAAAKYGTDRDGWRSLMAAEIDAAVRGVQDARMGAVAPLTARQTAALMIHQQNPSYPLDAARTADPLGFGLPSHDEFSAHVVEVIDAASGHASQWWHRTAAIRGDAMAVAARTQLWTLDLLIGKELEFVRSVSFHMQLIPAGEAKAAARKDVVRDLSNDISDRAHGRLGDDDNRVAITAAQRRRSDLAAGSHHHGVAWVGYITVSAPTRNELAHASRQLAEVCSTGLGIDRLDWQDSFQSSASGSTWPIGRGLKNPTPSFSSRLYAGLAGRSEKEAIS